MVNPVGFSWAMHFAQAAGERPFVLCLRVWAGAKAGLCAVIVGVSAGSVADIAIGACAAAAVAIGVC